MNTPSLADIPAEAQAEISRRLSAIERQHNVRLILAIESGSRAWGFASPDSDYDVRFIYAHPQDWYLTLSEGRDVIETPIEADMDVNGWDVRKSLRLALSSNPVLIEWLSSPIVYREASDANALRTFALGARTPRALIRHYLGLLQNTWDRDFKNARVEVPLKKYFYAIRPAVALAWLQFRGDAPPMALPALIEGVQLDPTVGNTIAELRLLKAKTHELGRGARIAWIDDFVTGQLAWAKQEMARQPGHPDPDVDERADVLFRALVAPDRSA